MKTLLTLFVLFISQAANSHEWKFIEISEENDRYFLDTKSVTIINGNIQYWVMVNYSKMLADIAYSVISKLEGDCYFYQVKILEDKYYAEKNGRGTMVAGSDIPDENWTDFPEDTMFGIVLEEACKLLKQ